MNKLLVATALLALAACHKGSSDSNAIMADANSSGNAAAASVENAVKASDATPLQKEQALALIRERHSNYGRIGKAMRAAKQGLDSNNLPQVRTAAATINDLAPQAQHWFPAGTGPDVGKTHAKAEIWQQPEQFALAMKDFRDAAAAFNQAAQGSDVGAMKAAQANLGKACGSCHDRFREKDADAN